MSHVDDKISSLGPSLSSERVVYIFDEGGTELLETEPWEFCDANMNS
jgi:hypothetical protein